MNLGPMNDGSGRCFGAVQAIFARDDSIGVLGTSFLKSQYVGFEAYINNGVPDGGLVWFAPKV